MEYLLCYLAVINFVSFFLCFYDKQAAIRQRWRISERKLFLSAIVGGSIGLYLSILLFRHKTRKLSFMAGIPLIMVIQFAGAWFAVNRIFG